MHTHAGSTSVVVTTGLAAALLRGQGVQAGTPSAGVQGGESYQDEGLRRAVLGVCRVGVSVADLGSVRGRCECG